VRSRLAVVGVLFAMASVGLRAQLLLFVPSRRGVTRGRSWRHDTFNILGQGPEPEPRQLHCGASATGTHSPAEAHQTSAAGTAKFTALYLGCMGLALLLCPRRSFSLLFDPASMSTAWIRVFGSLCALLAWYYYGAASPESCGFEQATVSGRLALSVVLTCIVIFDKGPRGLLLLAATNAAGALGMRRALLAGRVVVHVRAGSCTGVDFQAQVQHHGSRNGLCSTWLELVNGSECVDNVGMDDLGRTTRRVSVPLPRDVGNCSTLVFAFPPGQQYEYYNLVLPAAVAGTVYGSTRSAVDVLVARHVLDHDLLREQEAQPTSTVGSTDLIHKVAEMNMNRTAVEEPKLTCCHDDLAHVSARS